MNIGYSPQLNEFLENVLYSSCIVQERELVPLEMKYKQQTNKSRMPLACDIYTLIKLINITGILIGYFGLHEAT